MRLLELETAGHFDGRMRDRAQNALESGESGSNECGELLAAGATSDIFQL